MLTKYEVVHPKAVFENNSASGMLIILKKNPKQFIFQVSFVLAN